MLTNDAMAKQVNSHRSSRSVTTSLNQSAFIHAMRSYNIPGVFPGPL